MTELRACPNPDSEKKIFFEKGSPPRNPFFGVLFHVVPTVFSNFALIIGKNLIKMGQ